MKNFLRLAVPAAILTLGAALPAMAQIDNSVDFTTSFPFYAGDVQMPAGSYRITHQNIDTEDLLIESVNGEHSAFLGFVPTQAPKPHQNSAVTFQKYGDTEYLSRVWVQGQNYGMKFEPTKEEKAAAAASSAGTSGN